MNIATENAMHIYHHSIDSKHYGHPVRFMADVLISGDNHNIDYSADIYVDLHGDNNWRQICRGGRFQGDPCEAGILPSSLKGVAKAWYDQHIKRVRPQLRGLA